jgi:hypothetical protein
LFLILATRAGRVSSLILTRLVRGGRVKIKEGVNPSSNVIGRKRPTNKYAFALMYRRRRIRKRKVASSLYGIYPLYANTKIDKREVLQRSLL